MPQPREEQERVVLAELEVLVGHHKRGDLGELLGEQGAECYVRVFSRVARRS
jgi:hypothetical protein